VKFWRTKEFRILSKDWNDLDIEDIEVEIKGEKQLKQRATNSYRQATPLERETRLEYYCLLSSLALNTIFPNELEKLVMNLHADGLSMREIIDEIKKQGFIRERQTIRYIIRRWQMNWGIKSWTPKQMNLKAKIIRKTRTG